MIEYSEALKKRKEEWIKLGFLLPNEDSDEKPSYEFSLFGRDYLAEIRKSKSGYWDDFIANGTVHTHSIAFRKVRYLTEENDLLVAKQVVFFKWVFAWASWSKKTGEF